MQPTGRVAKRLSWYWQVEVANAVFVPLFLVALGLHMGGAVGWPTMLAMVPMCGLLVVGGLYWRGKLHAMRGNKAALDSALRLAHRFDRPLLLLSILACAIAVTGFVLPFPGSAEGDRWAATGAALLALAEYVNYYHRQLQHFDNWPDFRRLMAGKGFRPAKMAVDLAAWRARQRGRQAA
ncbi:MAG: hypothetical protein V2I74_05190 [Erythrobacter sp.]|nr:hypothetical protein [Erythrobacter sp.]